MTLKWIRRILAFDVPPLGIRKGFWALIKFDVSESKDVAPPIRLDDDLALSFVVEATFVGFFVEFDGA